MQSPTTISNWAAIILAGGKSSRMGQEKGLVLFRGKPMIAHVLEAVAPLVSDILIVANDPIYSQFGYKVVSDEIADQGPLSGICTGLRHSTEEWNLVLSCDVPLVSTHLLSYLIGAASTEKAVVVACGNDPHPLIGAYHRDCLPTFERLLAEKQLRMRTALEVIGAKVLYPEHDMADFDPNWLRNFNTPSEIAAFEAE